ncbi:hypothetical protein BN439_1369 [Erwinia amylovora Ea644]|uniref:hypothetical protein n=1 Tax=Erwinia amylovora TaxID=552 RepID=UPI0002CCC226|nr:hypothetical protein [Erwinia amylovora]CCP02448.1 hypothetical protein BN439_1369 [Erwinia amylovora Ea644]
MQKKKTWSLILGILFISGCQQFQSGINSIDSSIKSFNEKLTQKKKDSINNQNISLSSAIEVSGLSKICSDYHSNTAMSEKKWTGQVIRIQNAKILRVSEFNSAKTLGADTHGEYGILFRTTDTKKCMGVLHIQYYDGLENDIASFKKDELIAITAKISSISDVSNWSQYTESQNFTTVIDLTGIVTKL